MSGALLVDGSSSGESDDDGMMHLDSSSKKLNSLFSISNSEIVIGNTALVYKAPRQEDFKNSCQSSSTDQRQSKKVVLASPVHCFRLVEDQFTSQGKLGLAFLALVENRWYQVLIYTADKKPICKWTLKDDSSFSVRSNYVYFVDDQNFSWSLLFDDDERLIHFLALCLIAKSENSREAGKFSSIDLVPGDELNLKNDALLKCDCSEYLLKLGSSDDSTVAERNFFTLKSNESKKIRLGRKDVPEIWEQCLRNAKKSKKILLLYKTDENQEEKIFNVVLFHIIKIKASKFEDDAEKQKGDDQKSTVQETIQIDHKADLMSKIAKIGHQVAPFPHSVSTVESSSLKDSATGNTQQIQNQNQQFTPHCSFVCHCCHCAYYRNNAVPLNRMSTIENDIRILGAKFDQVISSFEQAQLKSHRELNHKIDLLADKLDKVLMEIDAKFSSKNEESP